jgi:hypothetical protein
MAVGNHTSARGTWLTYVARWTSGSWHVITTPNIKGERFTTFQGVACPSPTICRLPVMPTGLDRVRSPSCGAVASGAWRRCRCTRPPDSSATPALTQPLHRGRMAWHGGAYRSVERQHLDGPPVTRYHRVVQRRPAHARVLRDRDLVRRRRIPVQPEGQAQHRPHARGGLGRPSLGAPADRQLLAAAPARPGLPYPRAAAIASTAATVWPYRSSLQATGQVDNLATTVSDGPCTNTPCPLIPLPCRNGSAGSRTHQQFR